MSGVGETFIRLASAATTGVLSNPANVGKPISTLSAQAYNFAKAMHLLIHTQMKSLSGYTAETYAAPTSNQDTAVAGGQVSGNKSAIDATAQTTQAPTHVDVPIEVPALPPS